MRALVAAGAVSTISLLAAYQSWLLLEECRRAGGGVGDFGGGRGFGGGGGGGGARGRDRTKASRVVVWGSSAVDASGARTSAAASLSGVEGPVRAADAAFGVRVIAPAAIPGVDNQR